MVMRNGKVALAQDFGVTRSPSTYRKPRILAIDPGDVHVGLAEFERGPDGWLCIWAGEMNPDAFLMWLVDGLRRRKWDRIVVESWKLFPEAAPVYVGSDMPTSRLIGAIHALVAFIPEEGAWFDEGPHIYLQDPTIKVPTRGILRRRKLRSVAKILGVPLDHAADAELHGYKWLFDHKEPWANVKVQDEHWKDRRDLSPRHSIW